jgi:Lon protease-like protein
VPPDELIGLFPLGLVVVPHEVVPLHIFEERYKLLIAEREADGAEFGIVLAEDDGLREVGCSVVVAQVLERLEDGRSNILVEGRRRFRLLAVEEPAEPEAEYLRGRVEWFSDDQEDVDSTLQGEVGSLFQRMLTLMGVDAPQAPGGAGPLSYRIAAAVDFGAALKQQLLELSSESERLSALGAVIETLIPRLELRKEREEAIRGNGKGY